MIPKIVDFGLAHTGDGTKPLRRPIQPPVYHAPEVLLGAPWSYSADIWNFGVLVSAPYHLPISVECSTTSNEAQLAF